MGVKNLIKKMLDPEYAKKIDIHEDVWVPVETPLEEPNVSEFIIDAPELPLMEKEALPDDYLEYAPEAVGYGNREQQFSIYSTIATYLGDDDTIMDFGCGRGDFYAWYTQTFNKEPKYTGIDLSEPLINAGLRVYPNAQIICGDWNDVAKYDNADWCINVGSLNMRYDADTVTSDFEYFDKTVLTMFKKAERGVIILLASDLVSINEEGISVFNAGDILNRVLKLVTGKNGFVALDHSYSDGIFSLIIYK
jgi:SAM-dependent methyltransferase